MRSMQFLENECRVCQWEQIRQTHDNLPVVCSERFCAHRRGKRQIMQQTDLDLQEMRSDAFLDKQKAYNVTLREPKALRVLRIDLDRLQRAFSRVRIEMGEGRGRCHASPSYIGLYFRGLRIASQMYGKRLWPLSNRRLLEVLAQSTHALWIVREEAHKLRWVNSREKISRIQNVFVLCVAC